MTTRRIPPPVKVDCYAGYRADERPLRFTLGDRTYEVTEVLDRWYGVGYTCFKVRADDGNHYILRHEEEQDRWSLDAYRMDAYRKGETD